MPYNFGDVVLIPFPFTNQAASKQRPAVIVSSLGYNAARPDIVVMAITSQLHSTISFGEIHLQDWQSGSGSGGARIQTPPSLKGQP
jgi:mRNA interferase MazF